MAIDLITALNTVWSDGSKLDLLSMYTQGTVGYQLGLPAFSHKADGVTLLPASGTLNLIDYEGMRYQRRSVGVVYPANYSGFVSGWFPAALGYAPSDAGISLTHGGDRHMIIQDTNDIGFVQAWYDGGVLDPYGVPTSPATLRYIVVTRNDAVEFGVQASDGVTVAVLGLWDTSYLPTAGSITLDVADGVAAGLHIVVRN